MDELDAELRLRREREIVAVAQPEGPLDPLAVDQELTRGRVDGDGQPGDRELEVEVDRGDLRVRDDEVAVLVRAHGVLTELQGHASAAGVQEMSGQKL